MKGKLNLFSVQKRFNLGKSSGRLVILTWLFMSMSFVANSQEKEWWFDVEVIIYKRNIDPASIVEKFPGKLLKGTSNHGFENLYDYLYPDLEGIFTGLPLCFSDSQQQQEISSKIIMDDSFGQFEAFDKTQFTLSSDETANDTVVYANQEVANPGLDGSNATGSLAYLDVWQLDFQLEPIHLPEKLLCRLPDEKPLKPFIEKVPTLISNIEDPSLRHTQLLSADSFQLNELARDINRQRGLTTLLHMGWRQQTLFGQDNGLALHLFSGKNYGKEYDPSTGNRLPDENLDASSINMLTSSLTEQDSNLSTADLTSIDLAQTSQQADLIEQIKLALNNENFEFNEPTIDILDEPSVEDINTSTNVNDIWELDGTVKVFLRYIQRTPYLHIDSNIDFRAPVFDSPAYLREQAAAKQVQESLPKPDRLQSYPFNQLRRVISNQVHYFDHPMFGMIIQIRRYDLPASFDKQKTTEQ
ncbi:CsiV family protein [Aliiglaciecola lipolytica]|uniref:CsiV family protein n=1 Tax=Aliiglaciecola lipolytica TaxID=477689 RepID=UPI001C08D1B0|nr:CsiV family protein [Aliiglaciecola lipolytica]MBU2876988.1 hypothetical protein [Aliiglaciecola lipolytica]